VLFVLVTERDVRTSNAWRIFPDEKSTVRRNYWAKKRKVKERYNDVLAKDGTIKTL